jgi:hypothetical protein
MLIAKYENDNVLSAKNIEAQFFFLDESAKFLESVFDIFDLMVSNTFSVEGL